MVLYCRFAAGSAGRPLKTENIQDIGILNSHSLAWRLGRAIALARQESRLFDIPKSVIREFGGERSARVICCGKIISVEHNLTMTAHTTGKVLLQPLSGDESEGFERVDGQVVVEFINENLLVKTAHEEILAIVPDLIFLLDMATGEAIGTPEYR